MQYKTTSAAETKKIAKLFAQELLEIKPRKSALVILLKGDLGAGKTTFIQALIKGMGIRKRVVSPTFTLLRSYKLKANYFSVIHHFDCYRMSGEQEIKDLGFKEMVKDPKSIILIEWPERVQKAIPREKVTISFKYGDTLTERTITIK